MFFHDDSDVMVLDGPMGTEIQRHLCPDKPSSIDLGQWWGAQLVHEDPQVIRGIHHSYLEAGSNFLLTCTYQVFDPSVAADMADVTAEEASKTNTVVKTICAEAVRIAQEVVVTSNDNGPTLHKRRRIGGSCGPIGCALPGGLEFTGSYPPHIDSAMCSPQLTTQWFESKIEALVDAGADWIAFETFPRLDEALSVLSMVEEYAHSHNRAVQCSLSFVTQDGVTLPHNKTPLLDVLHALLPFIRCGTLVAAGFGCCTPAAAEMAARLWLAADWPDAQGTEPKAALWFKPNVSKAAAAAWRYDATPLTVEQLREDFIASVHSVAELVKNANDKQRSPRHAVFRRVVIGGCCGTLPQDIARVAAMSQ